MQFEILALDESLLGGLIGGLIAVIATRLLVSDRSAPHRLSV